MASATTATPSPSPADVDNPLSLLYSWLRGLAPAPETDAQPQVPAGDLGPLTRETVASIRRTIDDHDRGDFLRSALLADLLRRDGEVFGALQQRLTRLGACPLRVMPAGTDAASIEAAAALDAEWDHIASPEALADLTGDAVVLGVGVGQILWRPDTDGRWLVPEVDPWPMSCVRWDPNQRRLIAATVTGPVTITPGDGQWIVFGPRSRRAPHLWGAVRCIGEWYLRQQHADADASKHAEVHGMPVWKAYLPAGARETVDGKKFAASIRGIGRNAVVPLPRGREESESYDLELAQAEADAYKIFEYLTQRGGRVVRLALLGQDLTSANNQVGTNASSSTGRQVTADVVAADARALAACLTSQLAAPIARYRGTPASRVGHEERIEPAEAKARAEAQKATAEALRAWKDLGVEVDADAAADAARIPRRKPAAP